MTFRVYNLSMELIATKYDQDHIKLEGPGMYTNSEESRKVLMKFKGQ